VVRLALRVEIGAPLGTAHGQPGQAVLEGLLEGQKLQNTFGDGGMEPDTALVGPDGVVVLHPPTALHANTVVVILPANPEADDAIRLSDTPQDLVLVVLDLVLNEFKDVFGDLLHCLHEFELAGVATLDPLHELFKIDVILFHIRHRFFPGRGPQ
jgi:hypothetical protein